jgi:hypothetical protein
MSGILLTIFAVIILAPAILVALVVYGIRAARRKKRTGPIIEGEVVDDGNKGGR